MTPAARRSPARGRRAFAGTWWGLAWVSALEDSTLDSGRLSRGRTYARQGMVGEIIVAPGQIKAPVQGSRPRPYRSAVQLPVLTARQWDTLLDAVAARAGRVAALLDGEMPEDLVEDARAAGVPLLPEPTELDPDCSCPDWGYPCKHAAALCYAIAARIDDDPFVLFALRGRTREQVFAGLRERRAADRPDTADAPAGIPAAAAYARWAEQPSVLPGPPAACGGRAPGLLVEPPAVSGLIAGDLTRLAADAAVRAEGILAGDFSSLLLTQRQDAARLAASHRNPEWFHGLVVGSGLRAQEFGLLTRAWRFGGACGVTVATEAFSPEPASLAGARALLTDTLADMTPEPVTLKVWRNRLTLGGTGLQLRLGADGRWYPYAKESGDWWPCAPAEADPSMALAAAWDKRPEQG
jgi:uncharacterized Zn finger protein